MDVTLGISMAPASVRMVLVEGEKPGGVTIEEDCFGVAASPAGPSAADQVISAILGTREGAAEGGYQLTSTAVTWTRPADAAALRDALAARKVSNVMLVSAFLAAAALAQSMGNAIGYDNIALLYVEPETATLAVVNSEDGSITDVQRRALRSPDVATELAAMVTGVNGFETRPQGLFLVGSGVDVAPLKPALEAATWLPVSAPEQPDLALARGAALASANAPLFASSTAALAYAQDPGTGELNPFAVAPGYFEMAVDHTGVHRLAYSAVSDEDPDADIAAIPLDSAGATRQRRSPLMLVGSVLAVIVAAGALATVVTLAIGVRQTVALLPMPVQHLIVPTLPAPAPPPAAQVAAPPPRAVHLPAPAAVPAAPAPVAVPAAPAPIPAAPAPIPAAPAPIPAAPAPVLMPLPIPVRVPLPAVPLQVPGPQLPVNQPIPATPPAKLPTPPVKLPTPPAKLPTPPAKLPTPPAKLPTPPAKLPTPPAHAPTPPVQLPMPLQPPVNLGAPQPPVHMPLPAVPVQVPAPEAPQLPSMPAPVMPRMPAPVMPRMPAMPAPVMPRMPAMPAMPHFNMRMPALRF